MTETITPPETQAEPPHIIPRPATDGAAVRAIRDAANNFASKDMPGRQTEIQDCVNKILATVEQHPGAGQPAAG
jgi:hypothetical protein